MRAPVAAPRGVSGGITQVVWGYSALRGGLAYLPFIGGFIAIAGICTRLVSRFGARVPMTIGAALAPVAMFWLSRVNEHSHYLTGVCLPLLIFTVKDAGELPPVLGAGAGLPACR